MKKKLLLSILLIGCAKVYGQTKLTIPDTRDAVTLPTSYAQAFEVHFKRNASLNLSLPSMYSTVVGLRGWRDDSGGKAHELAFTNEDIYVRSGLNAGWEAWRKVLAENATGNVGIGITNPNSKLHVQHTEAGWNIISTTNASQVGQINGIRLHNGYVGEMNKWAGIASVAEDLHSNKTGLVLYTGYVERFRLTDGGNVGIGTTNPQAKLAVNGNILAKEIKVKTDISVPDYVFEPDYKMLSLSEVENYVKEHKHLPEVPSAKEIGEEGLDLAKINLSLLKKVEELTLHLIEEQKARVAMEREVGDLRTEINHMKATYESTNQ